MCVHERGFHWERPATHADCASMAQAFPNIDFPNAFKAMNVHGFTPLPTDLALLGGLLSSTADHDGIRSVPFSGFHAKKKTIVKLVVMDGIVPWMENTALGTAMWRSVSEWTRETRGTVIEFTMKCSCIEVPLTCFNNERYGAWLSRYNASRQHTRGIFGQSGLPVMRTISGTDITPEQFRIWTRMRSALLSLESEQHHAA